MGVICCGITLLVTFLAERWLGLGKAILLGVAGTYGSMFLMGGLTLLTEWDRIRASTGEKAKALFAFPLFMMTFIPIALTAVFRKFQWHPIAHTVAISASDLQKH